MDEEDPNVNQQEEEDEAFPALGGAQDQAGPDQGERDAPPAPQRQVRFGGGFAFGNRGAQAVQRRQVEALVGDQVQRIGNAVVGGTGVPANTPVAGGVDAGQGEIGAVRGQPVQQPQATGAAVTGPGAIHAAATALRQDVRHARKASKMADHQSFHDYRQTTLTYFGRYRVTGVLDGTVRSPIAMLIQTAVICGRTLISSSVIPFYKASRRVTTSSSTRRRRATLCGMR